MNAILSELTPVTRCAAALLCSGFQRVSKLLSTAIPSARGATARCQHLVVVIVVASAVAKMRLVEAREVDQAPKLGAGFCKLLGSSTPPLLLVATTTTTTTTATTPATPLLRLIHTNKNTATYCQYDGDGSY